MEKKELLEKIIDNNINLKGKLNLNTLFDFEAKGISFSMDKYEISKIDRKDPFIKVEWTYAGGGINLPCIRKSTPSEAFEKFLEIHAGKYSESDDIEYCLYIDNTDMGVDICDSSFNKLFSTTSDVIHSMIIPEKFHVMVSDDIDKIILSKHKLYYRINEMENKIYKRIMGLSDRITSLENLVAVGGFINNEEILDIKKDIAMASK